MMKIGGGLGPDNAARFRQLAWLERQRLATITVALLYPALTATLASAYGGFNW